MAFWDAPSAPSTAPAKGSVPLPHLAALQANEAAAKKASDYANSFWGIAANTVHGLQKAAADVGTDIRQGIARTVGSVGITAGNLPTLAANSVLPADKKQALPFSQSIATKDNPITKEIFGDLPINTIQQQSRDMYKTLQPYLGTTRSKSLAPLLVGGSEVLDLLGLGGSAEKGLKVAGQQLMKHFVEERSPKIIEQTLLGHGLDAARSADLAPKLAAARTEKEVREVLSGNGASTLKMTPTEGVYNAPTEVAPVDQLIADGKVRVVSRDGKDVYQTKQGDFWKNARDETSAVAKVTPKEKSEALSNAEAHLEIIKDALAGHPGAGIGKFVNNFTGELKKGGDVRYQDAVGQEASGGGDLSRLDDDKEAYQALKAQEAQARVTLKQVKASEAAPKRPSSDPLATEAQKYSSAEEFVNSQRPLYRGDNTDQILVNKAKETSFSTDKSQAEQFGKVVNERYLSPDAKVLDVSKLDAATKADIIEGYGSLSEGNITDYAHDEKFDAVDFSTGRMREFKVLNADVLKTKSQLTDFYNKAKGEAGAAPKSLKLSREGRPLALNAREKAIVENRTARPFEGGQGEVRSLETAAQALQEEVHLPPGVRSVSLEEIIHQTPVKKKINLLDYLRTPDRVLTKIGLGPQAKALRSAYESYLKELPKNINKIRAWSKSLPKDASKRIFRYLDGEAITLNAPEQKVADEIKTWLKEWADRLNLPEDNRLTNYVTHIFDDQLLGKEFDEDLAKIITDKNPGEVYNPFLQKRLGTKGYRQDVWAALEAYVKRGTRKVHMDPVLESLQGAVGSQLEFANVEASQFKYVQKYISGLNMRPTELDNLIDNTVKAAIGYRLGQRPLTRVTKFLRQMTYRALLGLNPGSALKNISQGINTYATLGEKYTVIGYAKLFNPASIRELKAEGVFNHSFIQDQTLTATAKAMEKIDKGLFAFFETAERINRGAAYFGAKAQGRAKGMTEEAAIEYAKKIVRKTQFDFSPVDTPVALQSDIAKTVAQFQNYSLKQVEFLGEMAKDKNFVGLLRYAVAGTAFVATIGQAFGMKYTDLIPSFRFETPASLKLPVEVGKAVLNTPDKYGQPRDLGKKLSDVGTAGIGLIPAGGQLKKTYQGAQAVSQGASTDKAGKVQFKVGGTPLKDIQALVFGKYASDESEAYFSKADTPAEKAAQETYTATQALVAQGKEAEAQAIVDGLSEDEYAAYKVARATGKATQTTADEQAMLPTVKKIQEMVKAGDTAGAQKIVDDFTDEEYRIYELAKKKVATNDSTLAAAENTSTNFVGDMVTYAKALGTDPVTAFNRIFTGQKILRLDNGTIIVERMPLSASTKIKIDRGATTEMRLDHTIPLELGGSNSGDNLKLVSTDQWSSYTPVENALGRALRAGTITKKQAQSLITDFKAGKITGEQVINQL